MKNVWKLSNYLYGWLWQKWTKVVTLVSMILAVCFLIAAAMPTGTAKDYDYYPKVFRSYDMVIDHSLLPILFALGLLLILIGIFVQIKGFSTNGKGIYTMLLLPMKRHEVYLAFVLSAAAAVAAGGSALLLEWAIKRQYARNVNSVNIIFCGWCLWWRRIFR